MTDWPDTNDIRHDFILTYTRNHDSYMTGVSLDSQREYYGGVFDAWLRKVKEDAWEEGKFDFIHYSQGARQKVTYPKNPYRD